MVTRHPNFTPHPPYTQPEQCRPLPGHRAARSRSPAPALRPRLRDRRSAVRRVYGFAPSHSAARSTPLRGRRTRHRLRPTPPDRRRQAIVFTAAEYELLHLLTLNAGWPMLPSLAVFVRSGGDGGERPPSSAVRDQAGPGFAAGSAMASPADRTNTTRSDRAAALRQFAAADRQNLDFPCFPYASQASKDPRSENESPRKHQCFQGREWLRGLVTAETDTRLWSISEPLRSGGCCSAFPAVCGGARLPGRPFRHASMRGQRIKSRWPCPDRASGWPLRGTGGA